MGTEDVNILWDQPGELKIVIQDLGDFKKELTFYSDASSTTTFNVSGAEISAGIVDNYGPNSTVLDTFIVSEVEPVSGGKLLLQLTDAKKANLKSKIKNNTPDLWDEPRKFLGYFYLAGKFAIQESKTKMIAGQVYYEF